MSNPDEIDPSMSGLDEFVTTSHSEIYPAINPSKVKLPIPFTVLVLGASRGIGAGVAYAYARAGASTVLLSSRRISGLETVATKCRTLSPLGEKATIDILPCDITDEKAVAALAGQVEQRFGGRLDVCVVNSGYSGDVHLKVEDSPVDDWRRCMDVTYTGTYLAAKFCLPLLKRSDGAKAFIAVGSLAAAITKGPIANAQYCISKHAQTRLIEMIAIQYQADNILAISVHPGAVNTEMSQQSKGAESFAQYLTDDADLCGAFIVWLTKEKGSKEWLNGRLVSANWDVDELVQKKDGIVARDLLKARYMQ